MARTGESRNHAIGHTGRNTSADSTAFTTNTEVTAAHRPTAGNLMTHNESGSTAAMSLARNGDNGG